MSNVKLYTCFFSPHFIESNNVKLHARVYHTLNNEIIVQFDIRFCPKKNNANIRRGRDIMLVGYFFV